MKNKTKISNRNTKRMVFNIKKPKSKYWLVSIVLLLGLIIYGSIFSFYSEQKQIKPKDPSASTKTSQLEIFPVKVYGLEQGNTIVDTKGGPAPCQPEAFDPKVNKFIKVKQNGIPSELYKIQGFENGINSGIMMIDGWYKQGESKVKLPSPFNVTVYNFGCASEQSSVIDLTKNGNRQALYTHVLYYSFSKDGKKIFLVNNINNQGTWTLHKRIIDIESKNINEIPNINCVSESGGFWQGDKLLTYAEDTTGSTYKTNICVWDKSANLISKIGATTAWGEGSRIFLAEKIGMLQTEPNIFYTYTSKNDNTCSLFLANIVSKATKSIDILNKSKYPQNYYCASPEVDFDFSGLYFNQGKLKYRIEKSKKVSGEIIWNDWQTTSLK